MNKCFIFIILFFTSFLTQAQESSLIEETGTALHTTDSSRIIQLDSSTISKKSFVKNFKDSYKEADFMYEFKTPEKNAWDRFKDWLAQLFQKLFQFSSNETSVNLVKIVLKVIAAAVVIFVIYLIVKAIINKEGQWIFGKDSHKKNINYSDIEKNIHLADFEKLIQESLQSGHKRISIRYYYLWLLKTMAQHHHIKWDIEKTNTDYLYELKNQAHKEEFGYLSYVYNYIWYGEFEIDENTFVKAEQRFKKALKTFSNV
ncbi:DUF4129 domain-containing protein [Flavobacterium sp. TAB 87]|uniref:DUF4129 domain-containing protein n=1 Tax=Flavobacterium sp. TAB 87 TaxID=1729581 RepID=UPI00076D10EF|nr:DUF4129 domain-containing protein [Flavobacterium sp. TAB 87]KVV14135.1 hypothetical protein AP058_02021 [Flavobacterium sp. TAB 87]